MKSFILLLVLASAQAFATETESSTSEIKTTDDGQVAQTEDQPERVKLDTIKVTPQERMPASWGGGGRDIR